MSETQNHLPEIPASEPVQSCPIGRPGQGSECGTSLWKPPKPDLRFLFLVVTLAAVWFALSQFQNTGSMSVISIIMLTFMFGCPRTRRAVLTVVPAMYLPFAWLLLELPASNNDLSPIQMWGQIPGMIPARFLVYGPANLAAIRLVASIMSLVVFFGGVLPIRFSKLSRWWFAIPLFAVCILMSLVARAFFRV